MRNHIPAVIESHSFNLLRWFSVLSLLSIVLVCTTSSILLSRFLSEHMLKRDAQVTMGFVESVAKVQNAAAYFSGQRPGDSNWEEFFEHIADMNEVLRTNAYDKERKVIWSSDKTLIGKTYTKNEELDDAFEGKLAIGGGITSAINTKAEHIHLSDEPIRYVENYVPIRAEKTGEVIGVVELYRTPKALYDTIDSGNRLIWKYGIASALFLYASLFWIVRRASKTIEQQKEQLVQSETMATVGEMASAVAHSIRNPLASIRSSAELVVDDTHQDVRETATDIIDEVDRMEVWVRDLLSYARPMSEKIDNECMNAIVRVSLTGYERELAKRNIGCTVKLADDLPAVKGNAALLQQAINSLITNGMEALPKGGTMELSTKLSEDGKQVVVGVRDSGTGISSDQLGLIFQPFHTDKPKGLGLGLPLTKRIVERHHGSISIDSALGHGTTVWLRFPVTT